MTERQEEQGMTKPVTTSFTEADRLTARSLLDEVMFGDHSNDSADAVIAAALALAREEGRRIERNAWLKALADSFLSEVDCRAVRHLALAPCDNCGGDAATCDCDES